MRALNDREKRTMRIALICIGAYGLIFGGLKASGFLRAKQKAYQDVLAKATKMQADLQLYQDKADKSKKWMETFHMDPAKLSRPAVMAGVSAAIQKAAQGGGVQMGPIREVQGRTSAQDLGSMQLEGTGPVPSLMAFLNKLETLGYPVIIDRIQFSTEASKPNSLKLSLTIVILDFEKWQPAGGPNA